MRTPLTLTTALSALIISALVLAPNAQAEMSLFERLGIKAPNLPTSTLLPQSVYNDVKLKPAPSASEPILIQPQQEIFASQPRIDVKNAKSAQSVPAPTRNIQINAPDPTTELDTILMAKAETPKTKATSNKTDKKAASMKAVNPWAMILKLHGTKDGDLNRFDYAALSSSAQDMKMLDGYITKMAAMTPSTMGRDDALAYWANLYNALTVQVVAKNWPVKSIKEIKSGTFTSGPWKRDIVTVEGRTLSLDGIEHDTMRAQYDEPRIHYMVNCASIGCPNLMLKEWKAKTLEADLTTAAKAFVNSARGAKVTNGKLTVSSIFKWYKEDFGDSDSGVIAHLNEYADADLKVSLDGITKISKDQYNWDVNKK